MGGLGVAFDDGGAELRIVALGIEHAYLEAVRENAFEQRGRERGLPAAGKPSDQRAPAVRVDHDRPAV